MFRLGRETMTVPPPYNNRSSGGAGQETRYRGENHRGSASDVAKDKPSMEPTPRIAGE
jgi:hypothetical protein